MEKERNNIMRTENIVLAEKSDILTVISAFFPEEVLEPDFADKGYYHNEEETRTLAVFDLSAVYTDSVNDLHIIFTWYGISALCNNHIKEILEKSHKITELTAKNEELQKAFDACHSNLCYQNQTVQIYRERHIESEKGKEAFERKALSILESKRNEIRALKSELTEKEDLINSLYNQISNVQYDKRMALEEKESDYNDLFEKYESEVNDNMLLSSKIHELEDEVYNLRKINEQLQDDKDYMNFQMEVLGSVRDSYEKQVYELYNELDAKAEVIGALDDSVNDLIEKLDSMESEKAELTDVIADNNECYNTLENEYKKVLDKNEELNEELTVKTNVIIMCKKLIKKLKRQKAESEGFANELQKKLYEYRSRFGMI